MKKLFIILGLVIVAAVAYYLISPAFIVVEKDEPLPSAPAINDNMGDMTAEEKEQFNTAVTEAEQDRTDMDEPMDSGATQLMGSFKPRAHEVEGSAKVIMLGEQNILRFEDFDTINGPNLHVYLSSELGDSDYIDLGELKATRGNFNYELDPSIDLQKYNKVLVWCVPFGVLFSYAELQ